ncbi:MAG TPA: hypothetical protein VI298_16120 [Geobacteraceae bacterium]
MPQFTIKINTYDPAIVEAFERLRKNRKQAAFTHEALKRFLESETGARVIDLMSRDHLSPSHIVHTGKVVEPSSNATPSAQVFSPGPCDSARDQCSGVLEKILE